MCGGEGIAVVSPGSGRGLKMQHTFFSARGFEHDHHSTINKQDD